MTKDINVMVCQEEGNTCFFGQQKDLLEKIQARLKASDTEYDDIFEVRSDELEYYVYELIWIKSEL